jgi:hypothetical protein
VAPPGRLAGARSGEEQAASSFGISSLAIDLAQPPAGGSLACRSRSSYDRRDYLGGTGVGWSAYGEGSRVHGPVPRSARCRGACGYLVLTSNGGVHNFGAAWYGSAAGAIGHGGNRDGADRRACWHLCDLVLGRGHRLSAYAADDAHFSPGDPPGCAAWVQVRTVALDPSALLSALKAGHYYSSTGPQIHAIAVRDGKLTVRCSPASKVLITGCVPGAHAAEGDALTECSLPLSRFEESSYIRVTVVDANGARAWSNPIWS